MSDLRNASRGRAILGANIIFNNRNSTLACQVRNFSATGAMLEFGDSVSVPQEFVLEIPQKGRSYRARLRWRDATGAGVEFIAEDGAPIAAKEPPLAGDILRRLIELEVENSRLREQVRELADKLARGGAVAA